MRHLSVAAIQSAFGHDMKANLDKVEAFTRTAAIARSFDAPEPATTPMVLAAVLLLAALHRPVSTRGRSHRPCT